MNNSPETVETAAWTNRELLLRTFHQVVKINGFVSQHHLDLYGSDTLGVTGLKQKVDENVAYRERLKVGVRVALAVAGTFGALLTAMIVLVVERL